MLAAVIVTAVALLVGLAVHEAAHALVMRKLGVRVVEAGLGLPIWPVLRIRRNGFTWTVSPWLLGAYVKPADDDQDKLEALPYRDASWYLNAGVVANLLLAAGLYAVTAETIRRAVIAGSLASVVWLARRWIAAAILPALAIPALVFIGYALAYSWSHGSSGVGYAGLLDIAPHDPIGAARFVASMSLSLAVLNTIPVFPLDNAKVVNRLIHQWVGCRTARTFQSVGQVLIAVTIAAAVTSDVYAAIM